MYRIFDSLLESEIPLPELPEAAASETAPGIRLSRATGIKQVSVEWVHEWRDDSGEKVIRCGQVDGGYVLRFPGSCDFTIDLSALQIQHMAEEGIPDETIRHLLLDQVIPRMLGQRGHLILHASAITTARGISIAFVGDSGWGKSTLASAFFEDGATLLTDDCLLIVPEDAVVKAIPNYCGIRLFRDSADAVFGTSMAVTGAVAHYSNKKRLLLGCDGDQERGESASLSAIFLLNDATAEKPSNDISVSPIGGAEEMMAIIKQMFVLNPTDTELMAMQFALVSKLMRSRVPIFRLTYPRRHSQLADVRQSVDAALIDNGIY